MNTAVINVKVQPTLKKQAQHVARDLGLSLSALINAYLKQLVKTKTVTFSANKEEPTEYLVKALKESEEDIKAGRVISFDSEKEALKYLDNMKKHGRKTRKN